MLKYIIRRVLMLIPVMLGVSLVVFTLMYITPGNPAEILLGEEGGSKEAIELLEEEMGLNDPYIVRFGRFIWNLVSKGDLGTCYATRQPVSQRIAQTFPNTLKLAGLSVGLAVVIGVVLGIVSAVKQYSIFDNVAMALAMLGTSMPNFWQGLLLMILFSIHLQWLPASGFSSFKHMILPAVTIGTSSAAVIARMTRSSMLEVIRQDYISTARAKGQSEIVVILRHALKNALIPIITTVGIRFGVMMGGAVLTESIFAIPGIGKMMVDAIKARNYPVVQGGVLVIALAFSVVNLIVDILYAFADPRLKSQYR
ncbi:MAG: ABC transporter permease [Bacillota bacterium]|nr:ABC transporter permease [Bacillota bacterium]MDD3297630.1 ABC transporter permease [Bacillota bacterium]MDD3850861.1 ABC transporter permease [Bacillota bacterium]MDD4707481.1 ABC transporter permease [Bacillota bacterium]